MVYSLAHSMALPAHEAAARMQTVLGNRMAADAEVLGNDAVREIATLFGDRLRTTGSNAANRTASLEDLGR